MSMIQLGPDLDGKAVDDGLLQPISLTHAKTMVAAGASKNSSHSSGLGQKWIQWNAHRTQVDPASDTVLEKNGPHQCSPARRGTWTDHDEHQLRNFTQRQRQSLTAAETATPSFSQRHPATALDKQLIFSALTEIQNATNDSSTIKQTN